ncbi:hypothetical protein ACWOAN_02180 [Lactococcus taiwanensis]|uniref:hypothetical protein n=1 Tax=Lactococcus taiwanensis TaxID=1151742 RepID=UPI001904890C|nr:hypothetical protein [Lactococcus taiwanensis]
MKQSWLKAETVLARGVTSTRTRDFYEVYMISKLRWNEINFTILTTALNNTMTKRESYFQLDNYLAIVEQLKNSQVQHRYGKSISVNITMLKICLLMKWLIRY